MYRVMIVDDEPDIRIGLRLKVDWTSLQLEVAAEASNGREALEKLSQEAIDIVITDMNMPVMNGVTFMEACSEQYPTLRLVVITGYEDFHYARAAVKSKAKDYLLKPVAQEELTSALQKIKSELDDERSTRGEQEAVKWRLSQYYKEMKEHFIVNIVKGDLAYMTTMEERSRLFQLDAWDEKSVRFIAAGLRERSAMVSSEDRAPDKLRMPFEMISREFAETYTIENQVFRDANYPGLLHFILPDDDKVINSFTEGLRLCVIEYLKFEPTMGVGNPVMGFNQWKEGYISSLLVWNLLESEVRYTLKDHSDGKAVLTEDLAKVIQRSLERGELDAFEQTVDKELREAFYESQVYFIKLIFQVYLLLDSMAYKAGIELDTKEQLWIRPNMVLGLDTVDKARGFLLGLGQKIHNKAVSMSNQSEQSMIQAAQQYIEQNYMYELNLTMIAERFNYNSTYFSELFKAKMGKTFIQYVTDARMAQAVRLLEHTTLSLWDIAELSGFSNASYFSSKFKRVYGTTPSEFRQQQPEKFNSEVPKK